MSKQKSRLTRIAQFCSVIIIVLFSILLINNITKGNVFPLETAMIIAAVALAAAASVTAGKAPKWLTGVMTAGMLVFIVSFTVLSAAVVSYAAAAADDSALPDGSGGDIAIVVLGCRTREEPGTMLRKRLDAAHELLLKYPDSAAVLCGGQGPNEPLSEAQSMYNYLFRRDIAPSRLYMEDKSTNTVENFKNAFEIIDSADELRGRKIIVVSSGLHLLRARHILKSLGAEDGGFYMRAAKSAGYFGEAAMLVREYMSWAKLIFTGV
ncbi:MAG: YdcF family protein [Clostridiales bacterium]|jgi:uncharacterized SAM-binding protein YcdF (DUF218 family)|nr:YdcF family protein [Clostridiales bacterium]